MKALGRGLLLKEAAHELGIATESAKTYASRAKAKLGGKTAAETVLLHEVAHRRCIKLPFVRGAGSQGAIPRSVQLAVVVRDGLRCTICGRRLRAEDVEFAQTTPRPRSGPPTMETVRVGCRRCAGRRPVRAVPRVVTL